MLAGTILTLVDRRLGAAPEIDAEAAIDLIFTLQRAWSCAVLQFYVPWLCGLLHR